MTSKNSQGIVIGTKLEAMWTRVKDATEIRILGMEEGLLVERELLKIAKDKILLEKRK